MSKEIYISSTPHETRLAIVENDALTEIYYERENEYTLAGSIYNGKVTRVLPGMQSSFVDIGLERDAFLYITDFMEEAGDSADFESNANSGDHRAPRSEARGEGQREGGRREGRRGSERNDRGDRGSDRTPAEPTDTDLFNAAVSSLDPARPVESVEPSDRSDRGERGERSGGRRGGRNRRDRNSDGSRREGQRTDAPRNDVPRNEIPVRPAETEYFRPDTPTLHVTPLTAAPLESSDTLGEGAPGADGSRRWRGRRGRRGGRGPGREESTPTTRPVASDDVSYVDYDRLDIDASAAPPVAPIAPPAASTEAAFTRPERSDRGERGHRDRGGRDRNERGGRGERGGDRGSRVPRGFAPRTPYAAADDVAPVYGQEGEVEAPTEPIILPGESLSKYRPASEQPTVAASSVAAEPTPVAAFTLAGSWDGGTVLPGETLRRREPSSDRGSSRSDRGSRNERSERNDRSDRGSRSDRPRTEASHSVAPISSTFVAPPPMPEAIAEPAAEQFPYTQPLAEVVGVAPIDSEHDAIVAEAAPEHIMHADTVPEPSTSVAVDSNFVHPVEAQPEPQAEQEYEPSEASASYRVDPVPPQEYRQPAPIAEIAAEPEDAPAPQAGEAPEELQQVFEEPVPEFQHEPETPVARADVTSINDLGEMHSEAPVELAASTSHETLPTQDIPEPAAPIVHETAVVAHSTPEVAGQFAPGSGFLEEEELVEDDELPTIHGSAVATDEFEEEETLEGAADLGSMIREMSIDQITRPASEAIGDEDEDDFEDFLEEDQDYTLEEGEVEGEDSEADSEEVSEFNEEEDVEGSAEPQAFAEGTAPATTEGGAEGRRDGVRREGRRGDRNRRSGRGREGRGDRDRSSNSSSSSSSSDRPAERSSSDRPSERSSERSGGDRGRRDGRSGRSAQSTNLPAISDLLKPGQEILCQIAKEPIARKGARITSHIALPGRFLVFMPTVNHTGVSRKIESDGERRRLKEILLSEKGEASGGFIVRTAAAGASEEELRSDLRFLLNLWTDIKTRSESSKSPALIYHDLNLVERVLRDQVTDTFSAIWVDTETEYERVLRFLQRFQPSLIRRVKLYSKETPLFEQFGITEEINKALRSKVWLKSGGSIVINQTEALVAIDINTGKYVGKTARLEDTIVKTNLDAIPEIVRQIRLRDLGGIIIIDFIDMDERKNRNKVMAALEEELKSDRAPSKVLQFNDFGLVAITRKRVKQSLERTLSTTCGVCAGTGMVKSPVTVCNDIYIEMRKMHKHMDRGDVMLRVNPEVVKQLKAPGTKWLQEMEEMCGKTILVKSDPSLHPEQFDIH